MLKSNNNFIATIIYFYIFNINLYLTILQHPQKVKLMLGEQILERNKV